MTGRTGRKLGRGWEVLQQRRLLAADISLDDGYIRIEGTDDVDAVEVWQENDQLVVDAGQYGPDGSLLDHQQATFAASQVRGIYFDGKGGDDLFVNDTDRPAIALGGGGNDILIGGPTRDTMLGNLGDDFLAPRSSGDLALGSAGDNAVLEVPLAQPPVDQPDAMPGEGEVAAADESDGQVPAGTSTAVNDNVCEPLAEDQAPEGEVAGEMPIDMGPVDGELSEAGNESASDPLATELAEGETNPSDDSLYPIDDDWNSEDPTGLPAGGAGENESGSCEMPVSGDDSETTSDDSTLVDSGDAGEGNSAEEPLAPAAEQPVVIDEPVLEEPVLEEPIVVPTAESTGDEAASDDASESPAEDVADDQLPPVGNPQPGNDILVGGSGHDWLFGGEGDDWLFGDDLDLLASQLLSQLMLSDRA
ncbi:MAG: hypothetical protein J5I93_28895 [Pirellulaceae bacterium]|nr:hypothetical protein [Pirellulaceae bacterium]